MIIFFKFPKKEKQDKKKRKIHQQVRPNINPLGKRPRGCELRGQARSPSPVIFFIKGK
jgi:hypothetical protein